jgi:ParB/RepB/Spo0J family partition protein
MDNITENNQIVGIEKLSPNKYNPKLDYNLTTELKSEFERIKNSLKAHGQIDPIVVRETETKDNYEIIDGYHRWSAMKELGYTQCEIKNLGQVSLTQAIAKTLSLERTKISIDAVLEAQLLKDYREAAGEASDLPYTEEELAKRLELAEFSFDNFNEVDLVEANNKEIETMEKAKRFYFAFENKEDFERVCAFFQKNAKSGRLDSEALINFIDK